MAVADLSIQVPREKVMDFILVPHHYEYLTVILKRPDINVTKWRLFIDPLQWEVLLSIGAILPIATVILVFSEKVYSRSSQKDSKHAVEAFMYLVGALFAEGGLFIPRSNSGRIVVSTWWMFTLIMMCIYCGKLVAFLAVPIYKLPFNSIAEMVEQNEYKWGLLGGTFYTTYFETSSHPVYKKVWAGIVRFNDSDPTVLSMSLDKQIQKVLSGSYAFIADYTGISTAMASHCDLIQTSDKFFHQLYAVGLPNNSPFTKILSKKMLDIVEGGLIETWKNKWWPKSNNCDMSGDIGHPVSMADVQGLFYAVGFMIVLAAVCLSIELIMHHCMCSLPISGLRYKKSEYDLTRKKYTLQVGNDDI